MLSTEKFSLEQIDLKIIQLTISHLCVHIENKSYQILFSKCIGTAMWYQTSTPYTNLDGK